MKRIWLVPALLTGIVAGAGCHHRAAPTPPAPPPVAPTAPPPAPPPPTPTAPAPVQDEYSRLKAMDVADLDRLGLLQDVHFDFDRADIREVDQAILAKDAEQLKKFDFIMLTVEGHCDERGTVEYNLALGDRRARAARDYLAALGVPAVRLKTVSYGKEVPLCTDHDEACWQRNRRAHLRITGKAGGR
jgi:peptidoglycan-associated lipoprotein